MSTADPAVGEDRLGAMPVVVGERQLRAQFSGPNHRGRCCFMHDPG